MKISFESEKSSRIELINSPLRLIKILTGLLALGFLIGCSSTQKKVTVIPPPPLLDDNTFKITDVSTDKTYGYSESNPIRVGNGPKNARRYLNALAGPKGQKVTYTRTGSCCTFKTPLGYGGIGQLDKYKVTWQGQAAPIILYLNMFESGVLKSPVGLTIGAIKTSIPVKSTKKVSTPVKGVKASPVKASASRK